MKERRQLNEVYVGLGAIFCNIAFWLLMFFVQTWESRTGRIFSRRKWNPKNPDQSFLYLQDFWTNGWLGDLIALSFIDFSVAAAFFSSGFHLWMISLPGALGIAVSYFLKISAGPTRRQNWSYINGRVTWGGRVHTAYFIYQAMAVFIGLGFLATGHMTPILMTVALIGGGLYLAAFLADSLSGKITWSLKDFQ